ncbi:hypothetical protein JOF34_002036 [Microbacterium amylolyticum]|uniref:Uncharacterized protein n=1 Tax=Microbacterium amylolyticum TaxID=936337 RepID=A0ABS4ZJJ6_9MICO|nr:hypothetical protein [Microbacterium amylolyticum]
MSTRRTGQRNRPRAKLGGENASELAGGIAEALRKTADGQVSLVECHRHGTSLARP